MAGTKPATGGARAADGDQDPVCSSEAERAEMRDVTQARQYPVRKTSRASAMVLLRAVRGLGRLVPLLSGPIRYKKFPLPQRQSLDRNSSMASLTEVCEFFCDCLDRSAVREQTAEDEILGDSILDFFYGVVSHLPTVFEAFKSLPVQTRMSMLLAAGIALIDFAEEYVG
jgi:hypothetical protein